MESSTIPLALAAAVFLAFLVWRVRPAFLEGTRKGATRDDVRAKLERAEAAKDDAEKAALLCDAAELLRVRGAVGLYVRALRADPASVKVVERAIAGLAKRPRALEKVLWRHLANAPWKDTREATAVALDGLRSLYEGPLRSALRAKAFGHARDAMRDKVG
jgi:hypothetical protein